MYILIILIKDKDEIILKQTEDKKKMWKRIENLENLLKMHNKSLQEGNNY